MKDKDCVWHLLEHYFVLEIIKTCAGDLRKIAPIFVPVQWQFWILLLLVLRDRMLQYVSESKSVLFKTLVRVVIMYSSLQNFVLFPMCSKLITVQESRTDNYAKYPSAFNVCILASQLSHNFNSCHRATELKWAITDNYYQYICIIQSASVFSLLLPRMINNNNKKCESVKVSSKHIQGCWCWSVALRLQKPYVY